jgi:hypothetical protein
LIIVKDEDVQVSNHAMQAKTMQHAKEKQACMLSFKKH